MDFRAPNGYALAIGHGAAAVLRGCRFADNRAAIFLPSDNALVTARDRSTSASVARSTVSTRLSLQNVVFEGSGGWSAAEAYRGGGDVAAFDHPRVYSDRNFTVPHVCGTHSCPRDVQGAPTLPLACGGGGAFLSGASPSFAALQQARLSRPHCFAACSRFASFETL